MNAKAPEYLDRVAAALKTVQSHSAFRGLPLDVQYTIASHIVLDERMKSCLELVGKEGA